MQEDALKEDFFWKRNFTISAKDVPSAPILRWKWKIPSQRCFPISYIRIRIYHGVCIALYFHYVGTDRRSFANFIECELELLKCVFLPVINLSFLGLICDKFDRKRVPVSRSFVSSPRPRKNIVIMKDGHMHYIFKKNSYMILYYITNHFIIIYNKKNSTINFHDFHFFNSCIFKIFIRHCKP